MYIHYPFAEVAVPPTTTATHYQPLRGITLPMGVRYMAGFVHENRRVLDAIERARGEVVDVASSCGLGRRTPAEATRVLELTAQSVAH